MALDKNLKTSVKLLVMFLGVFSSVGVMAAAPLPELVSQNGKHMLKVDGAPYLVLGAQANNSSNYPAALKDVWPSVEKMQANTLSIPVAWEQVEPVEGQFDFSYVDVLLKEARAHNKRLVLLWFATWKNNGPQYAPAWVKLDNKRFPRVVTKDGGTVNSLSPLSKETLAADKKAFLALMSHLKKVDSKNTVIMVQIENESGTWGAARDYSPMAEAVFNAPVPAELVKKLGVKSGSWPEVFGKQADEFFHAYHIAKFCDELAAEGKAIKALPMYANAALTDPFSEGVPGATFESGGPVHTSIPVWRAAAPHLDFVAPDIYNPDHKTVSKWLELYSLPNNPLFVAEIGNKQDYGRYLFSALGQGAIGFTPFGMDDSGYMNYPLGEKVYSEQMIENFAKYYRLFANSASEWARLNYESQVWGVSEPLTKTEVDAMKAVPDASQAEKDAADKKIAQALTQKLDLGLWDVEVTYGRPMFFIAPPKGNDPAIGGAAIAKLGDNEFLVTALQARVDFMASKELQGHNFMIDRVEEGHFEKGKWVMERVWNGDQADWGLNFSERPHLLKVKMATYTTK